MNIIKVIVAFVIFTMANASNPQLVLTVAKPSYAYGDDISFTVTVSGNTDAQYTVNFVDQYGNSASFTAPVDTSTDAVTRTPPTSLYGTVKMTAIALDPDSFQDSDPVYFVIYTSMIFNSPVAAAEINYGNPVTLNVSISGPSQSATKYTATFTCPTGVFIITGLNIDQSYNIVPGGIYGSVIITVTAENTSLATIEISINKPMANIPPAFVPGRMPYYPSVHANMKEDGNLDIVSVEYLTSPPI